MVTTFDKALVSAALTGGSAYAAFTSSCASAFAVFGTHSSTAQIASAALIAVVSGVLTWLVPNKKSA